MAAVKSFSLSLSLFSTIVEYKRFCAAVSIKYIEHICRFFRELNFDMIQRSLHRRRAFDPKFFPTVSLSTISRECKRKRKEKGRKGKKRKKENYFRERAGVGGDLSINFLTKIRTPRRNRHITLLYEEHMIIDAHMIDEIK